jgi:hypothetical protein
LGELTRAAAVTSIISPEVYLWAGQAQNGSIAPHRAASPAHPPLCCQLSQINSSNVRLERKKLLARKMDP